MSTREAETRDLRLEVASLNESRKALEGLAVLGDVWATTRLGEVEAAISDTQARLTDLQLEAREATK